MIDEIRIRDWLAAYRHAWSTDDPGEIAALFTEDVRYFTAPYRAPLEGAGAITDYWVGEREGDIPWSFEYQVLAQEDDLFVVRAVTTYPRGDERRGGSGDLPQPLAGDAGRATAARASSSSTSCSWSEPAGRRRAAGRRVA